MSHFFGYEFMYNNTLSSKYGLYIAYINPSATDEHPIASPVSLITRKLPRRSRLYKLGFETSQDGFEFKMTLFREQDDPILASERNAIANWLCGNPSFKKLKIIQDDMCSAYYNCYFKEINYIALNGYANAISVTAVCDAPFAWKNSQTVEKTNEPVSNGIYPNITQLKLYNLSSDHNLTLPKLIEIDLGENTNSFRLTNHSNDNEFFEFNNLVVGDKIRIDDLLCIHCSTRPNTVIVDNFSGEFLHLVNGLNRITVDGQIRRIKVVWQSGIKIG